VQFTVLISIVEHNFVVSRLLKRVSEGQTELTFFLSHIFRVQTMKDPTNYQH